MTDSNTAPDAPPGSFLSGWDAHAHVIGDERDFPFAPGRSYTPQPASLESYLAMLDRHGLAHGVLVQPSVYGFDHGCLLDALHRASGRLAGIAVPAPDATPADLERLHRHGVRGVRCNLINPGGLSLDVVSGWGAALRALGWHVEIHVPLADVPTSVDRLRDLDVPVVVDHMGRPTPGCIDPDGADPTALIDLVRSGRCFVKLSAPYRLSSDAPPWPDVAPLARALVAANPEGCLWGSDWPHVDVSPPVETDRVLSTRRDWCPDQQTRQIVSTAAASRLFDR